MVIALILFSIFRQFDGTRGMSREISYSQFMEEARQGAIKSAVVDGRTVRAITTDDRQLTVNAPQDLWMVSDLMKYGVIVSAKPEEQPSLLMSIFCFLVPNATSNCCMDFLYEANARRWSRGCFLIWQIKGSHD
jgi:cell division protease FtsH